MIDYEKLKLAHSLADKYCQDNKPRQMRTTSQYFEGKWKFYLDLKEGEKILFDWEYDNIDDMLEQLQELTQEEEPKPKYQRDDKVWTYTHGVIKYWLVDSVTWEPSFNDYRVNLHEPMGKASLMQSQLYPTKAALIEAQIAYWLKLDYDEQMLGILKGERVCPQCNQLVFGDYDCPCCMAAPEYPEIQPAPYVGNISVEKIQAAVDSSHVTAKFCTPVKECQHEDDGQLYSSGYPDVLHGISWKCKKCGDFYR